MKKKMFSLMAVVLFIGSSLNATSNFNEKKISNTFMIVNCWRQSDIIATWAGRNLRLSDEQEYELFSRLYEECRNEFYPNW